MVENETLSFLNEEIGCFKVVGSYYQNKISEQVCLKLFVERTKRVLIFVQVSESHGHHNNFLSVL